MTISRRTFVMGSAITAWVDGVAAVEEEEPFNLELPDTELDPNLPTFAAVVTSDPAYCQVLVSGSNGKVLESANLSTESGSAVGAKLNKVAGGKPGKYTVQIRVQPRVKKRPSVSYALTQGQDTDLERLKRMSKQVHFKEDPASSPGHFELDLTVVSSVVVQIWRGERAAGIPVFETRIGHAAAGQNIIAWNLLGRNRVKVPPGRYFGSLVCTPENVKQFPTNCASYFGVT